MRKYIRFNIFNIIYKVCIYICISFKLINKITVKKLIIQLIFYREYKIENIKMFELLNIFDFIYIRIYFLNFDLLLFANKFIFIYYL